MQVALVTCRHLPDLTADDRLLIPPLQRLGITARAASWDDPDVDWRQFAAVVIRSAWDYHVRTAAFRRWIDDREAEGVTLCNSPRVLRWNVHKCYLRDLVRSGVPVVPTVWIGRGEKADLATLLRNTGWSRAVVKPAISAEARHTWTVDETDAEARQPQLNRLLTGGDVLVQPFLEQVPSEGEWSFLFFGGTFSHAVLKKTGPGDFRVQEKFGGSLVLREPVPGLVERAADVLQAAARILDLEASDFLYARVDAVRNGDALVLVELEVLEPSLFLSLDSAAPERLAGAIAARVA